MTKEEVVDLIDRYQKGNCTAIEMAKLESWYIQESKKAHDYKLPKDLNDRMTKGLATIFHRSDKKTFPLYHHYRRMISAAIIILAIGALIFINDQFFSFSSKSDLSLAKSILPGHNQAVLTFADGRKITLGQNERLLAQLGSVSIHQETGGQVVYRIEDDQDQKNSGPLLNTISTPIGGQYHIILEEGTRVWLNAGSSITFPTAFADRYREVSITGEVYFEVSKNPRRPFRVKSAGQTVDVLGTHFNINSYPDEAGIKTTLIEGKVRVVTPTSSLILHPGQASNNIEGSELRSETADIASAISWKDGLFKFKSASVSTVMRQLARWYNVEVEYKGNISEKKITGEIHRNVTAAEALEILKYLKINFLVKQSGAVKKIIVQP